MEFEFVIVGAGAAGCVLANRLSGLPQAPSVCLIERGPAHTDSRWNVAMAAAFSYNKAVENERDLWLRYLSEFEKQLNGRRIECPRGIGWGGSTAINGMVFVRGQPEDFDRWARDQFCGNIWSFQNCLQYFKRLDSYNPGFDLEDAIDPEADADCSSTISEFRGFEGPVKVTSGRYTNRQHSKCAYFPAFIRAGIEAGHKYNPNCNGPIQEGVGWLDAIISDGIRQSSSRCYLLPALKRNNLTIISNALVSRVILEDKRAVCVEYISSNGKLNFVRATKEVILSGGAYNSPQLLMLSGIGDPAELRKVGIEPLHELPGVGRNLQDHLRFSLQYETRNPEISFNPGNWQTEWANRMRSEWETSKSGWGASNNLEVCLFLKTNPSNPTANIECCTVASSLGAEGARSSKYEVGISVDIVNERPQSIGRLTLRSNNPADDLIIEHNYFSVAQDVREMVDAIAIVRRVFTQPALSEYVGEELQLCPNQSDAALEQFVRASSTSCFHPCGTCRMGDPNAAPTPEAARQLVVDAELRVVGLHGLRVVDASVMPSITSGNTNAATWMIAEHAADNISSTSC